MFKIAAYKHIDCENVVVCNRAEWDGNQARLPGSLCLLLPLRVRRGGRRTDPRDGVGARTGRILKEKTDCKQSINYYSCLLF